MQDPDQQPQKSGREALAPRLFCVLFLMLGLIIMAAQVRATVPIRSVDGALPAALTPQLTGFRKPVTPTDENARVRPFQEVVQ